METKYYTPSIEEFHIGFELEYLGDRDENNNRWHTLFIKDIEDLRFTILGKPADRFRVKYLNQEDIESLGFKTVYNNIKNTIYGQLGGYYIDYTSANLYCKIHTMEDTLFIGKIKNKSELRKLMLQISFLND